jgi:hypothetical protein
MAAWTKRRARPPRVHAESTGAKVEANAARGKSARAGRGVPGGSKGSAKRNTGEEEGRGEQAEAEAEPRVYKGQEVI